VPSGQIAAPAPCTDHATSPAIASPLPPFAEKCTTSPVFTALVAGHTTNFAKPGFTTSTDVSPVTPSPAARIFVLPGLSATTIPVASTVATDDFSDVHVSAISMRGSPFAFRGVARNK